MLLDAKLKVCGGRCFTLKCESMLTPPLAAMRDSFVTLMRWPMVSSIWVGREALFRKVCAQTTTGWVQLHINMFDGEVRMRRHQSKGGGARFARLLGHVDQVSVDPSQALQWQRIG